MSPHCTCSRSYTSSLVRLMGLGSNYQNFRSVSVIYDSGSARLTTICNETYSLAQALGSWVKIDQIVS